MANPQKENGHIDIANEIAEYLAKYRLSGQEWQVLWVILRKTWGWHKKKDRLSFGYIAKMTLMKRPTVARAIKKLLLKGVIKKDNSFINFYMFNKDYERWKSVIKKDNLLSKRITGVIKKDNKSVIKKDTTTKENTKEKKQKKVVIDLLTDKSPLFKNTFDGFIAMRKKKNKPMTEYAKRLLLDELNRLGNTEGKQIKIMNQSIMHSWTGVYELKEQTQTDSLPELTGHLKE